MAMGGVSLTHSKNAPDPATSSPELSSSTTITESLSPYVRTKL